jgi:hypothetical protein
VKHWAFEDTVTANIDNKDIRNMISIKGLDKAVVLQALHSASKAQSMGFMHFDPKGLSLAECNQVLESDTYVDYLQGRVIKVDFSGEEIDPYLFDRDNGTGALERVVSEVRSK